MPPPHSPSFPHSGQDTSRETSRPRVYPSLPLLSGPTTTSASFNTAAIILSSRTPSSSRPTPPSPSWTRKTAGTSPLTTAYPFAVHPGSVGFAPDPLSLLSAAAGSTKPSPRAALASPPPPLRISPCLPTTFSVDLHTTILPTTQHVCTRSVAQALQAVPARTRNQPPPRDVARPCGGGLVPHLFGHPHREGKEAEQVQPVYASKRDRRRGIGIDRRAGLWFSPRLIHRRPPASARRSRPAPGHSGPTRAGRGCQGDRTA
jgi:hypothetical protein